VVDPAERLSVELAPPDSTPIEGALDPTALESLREMVDGDVSFLAELIHTFLADAPQLLADMRQAMERGDAAGLNLAAHSLKSDSAYYGAVTLSSLCRELEMLGKLGRLDMASEKVAQAEAEYERVEASLAAVRFD
jgi:HPt (histidine-containing phosphotransfer) domain-containing protein